MSPLHRSGLMTQTPKHEALGRGPEGPVYPDIPKGKPLRMHSSRHGLRYFAFPPNANPNPVVSSTSLSFLPATGRLL